MYNDDLYIDRQNNELFIRFYGKFDLYSIAKYQKKIYKIVVDDLKIINLDLTSLEFLDTSASIFIHTLQKDFEHAPNSLDNP